MKLNIIDKKEMPLLQREIINLELDCEHSPTPKKEDVAKELVSLLKTKDSLLKVKNIWPKYGEDKARIRAFVYGSEEALKTFEKQKNVKVKKESGKEKSQEQKKQ